MSDSSLLKAGFGVQDFTPDEPPDGSFRVFDPISFRALILQEGDTNVTFLAGDVFSIEEGLIERVRERLQDIAWLNPYHILPCAAHIGTTPILFQSYVNTPCEALRYYGREDFFIEHMTAAIRKAAQAMKPARIAAGLGAAPHVLYNRRSYDKEGNLVMSYMMFPYPRPELTYGEVDENVYVIRVDDEEGTPIQCAFIFGCHALCSLDKWGHISADYPGAVRKVLKGAGIESLFLPGALGNVAPISRGGRTYERVGHSVAGAALYALEQLETSNSPGLRVCKKTIQVPCFAYDPETTEADLKSALEDKNGRQRFRAYVGRHYQAGRTNLQYTMTRISIDGADIIYMPGEIFVETAKAIQRAGRKDRLTIIVSGPTADVGYLSTPDAHKEGGMEPHYAGLDIDAEAMIRAAACELAGA